MARHHRSRWHSIIAAAVLVFAGTAHSRAQNFQVINPPINAAQARALSGQVATILRNTAAPGPAEIKVLDDFFMRHYYPAMTNDDPIALGQLGEKREDLFGRYFNQIRSQQTRDHLNSQTVKAMSAIAKGRFHPAVRYNAALILGQLDAQPAARPLPAATEALLSLLENDQFNNVPVPTAVKVAALVGLERQVRLGVDEAAAGRITKAALAIANREDAPEDASIQTYGWVRRQAADVLAAQFETGLTPPVYQTFVRLVRNDKMHMDDRCAVAELLKPTMFQGAEGLNLEDMTLALGSLAREVLDVEAEEAREFLDEVLRAGGFGPGLGGGRGGFGMRGGMEGGFGGRGGFGEMGGEFGGRGGFGGGLAMPMEEQGPKYEKRRMIDRTLAIVTASQAVAAGGSDELKDRLTEFATAIQTVAEAAAPENATDEDITASVVDLEQDISDMVAQWAPPQVAEEEAAEEPEFEAPADDAAEATAEGAPAADPPVNAPPAEEAPAEDAPAAEAAPAEAAGN